jgi:hypothetical protein
VEFTCDGASNEVLEAFTAFSCAHLGRPHELFWHVNRGAHIYILTYRLGAMPFGEATAAYGMLV